MGKPRLAGLTSQDDSVNGTFGYMAPEVILSKHYSAAADVFSCGVVLFIMLSGVPPFEGETVRETLERSVEGMYEMNPLRWSRISQAAKEVVRKMLVVDPAERMTVQEFLDHPWLKKRIMSVDGERLSFTRRSTSEGVSYTDRGLEEEVKKQENSLDDAKTNEITDSSEDENEEEGGPAGWIATFKSSYTHIVHYALPWSQGSSPPDHSSSDGTDSLSTPNLSPLQVS